VRRRFVGVYASAWQSWLDRVVNPLREVYGELLVVRPPIPATVNKAGANSKSEVPYTGVTLRLLHEEYVLAHPNSNPYGYRKFVEFYNAWADRLKITMRQVHKACEKCFVDYSGKRPSIRNGGPRLYVEHYVMVYEDQWFAPDTDGPPI